VHLGLQTPRLSTEHFRINHLAPTSTLKVPVSNLTLKEMTYKFNSTKSVFQLPTPPVEELDLKVLKRGPFYIDQVGELSFGLDSASPELPSSVVLCEGNPYYPAVEVEGLDLRKSALISRKGFFAIQSRDRIDKIVIFNPFTISLETADDGAELLDFLPTNRGFKLLMADNGCVFEKKIDFFGDLISTSEKVLKLEDPFSSASFNGLSSILILTPDNKASLGKLNKPCEDAASSIQFSEQCLLVKYGSECVIVDLADNTLKFFFPAAGVLNINLADLVSNITELKFDLFKCAATQRSQDEIVVTLVLKDNRENFYILILITREIKTTSPQKKFVTYLLHIKIPTGWFLTSATVDRRNYLWLALNNFWRESMLLRSTSEIGAMQRKVLSYAVQTESGKLHSQKN
jgi:hypothetical protein